MLNTKQTNNRVGSEWYTCDRCGCDYPRAKVLVHNGLVLCSGPGTFECRDKPGRDALQVGYPRRVEEEPKPLPQITEDV